MTSWDQDLLDAKQSEYVAAQLGAPFILEDLTWNLVDTKVLRVRAGNQDVIVKAAQPTNHHISREITAHETIQAPPRSRSNRAPRGRRPKQQRSHHYLPPWGLVEGTRDELSADVHKQAGSILRAFHDQHAQGDDAYERRMTDKATALLDQRHQIAPQVEAKVRQILCSYQPKPSVLVPTHGDWQLRNWLIDGDMIRVIDFGRFDLRPPATDLCRLTTQQWKEASALESAFLDGYGRDPRDEPSLSMNLLWEAIGTAVWAFMVGDDGFEAQGHRTLNDAIGRF